MAKNKSDDDEVDAGAEDAEGEGKSVGGKKMLIIIIAAILLLGGVGAGLYFGGVIGGASEGGEEKAEAPAAKKAESGHGEKGKEAPVLLDEKGNPILGPTFYEMPEFLVNLSTTGQKSSFLKMKITLELTGPEQVALMDANKPRLQDVFNTYLREMRAADLSGSAGIYRLREELLMRVNKAIAPQQIKDILFSEIIVQ